MKTPNSKQLITALTVGGSGIAGAKLSDGIAAVLPSSMGSFRKFSLAVLGIGIAVMGASNIKSGFTQDAVIGLGTGFLIKQGGDALTDLIKPKISPKDNTKALNRFVNGFVGHNATEALGNPGMYLPAGSMPWSSSFEPTYEVERMAIAENSSFV